MGVRVAFCRNQSGQNLGPSEAPGLGNRLLRYAQTLGCAPIACIVLAAVLGLAACCVFLVGRPAYGLHRMASLVQTRDTVAAETSRMFRSHAALLNFISASYMMSADIAGRDEALHGLLRDFASNDPTIANILIFDPQGRVMLNTADVQGDDELSFEQPIPVLANAGSRSGRLDKPGSFRSKLMRTSEAGPRQVLSGVGESLPARGGALSGMVYILGDCGRFPSAGPSIGRTWLMGDDGALLSQPCGLNQSHAIADITHSWWETQGDGSASGTFERKLDGADHLLLFRHLDDWPATLLIDTGPTGPRGPTRYEVAGLGLVISALLCLGLVMINIRRNGRIVPPPLMPADPVGQARSDRRPLTGDMAHEMNNVLTALSLDAEMIAAVYPADARIGVLSRSMLSAADRGAALARMLMGVEARGAEGGTMTPAFKPGSGNASSLPVHAGVTLSSKPQANAFGSRGRILVVDDSALVRHSIARRLSADGYEVKEANDVEAAEAAVATGVDLMVTDIVLNDAIDGFALAVRVRAINRWLPIVFMSGFVSARQPELLANDDLAGFLRKPINGGELNAVIAGLLALRETRRGSAALPIVPDHR